MVSGRFFCGSACPVSMSIIGKGLGPSSPAEPSCGTAESRARV
ncbi:MULTISPECIES: hypothetical protein [Rhizobium/Agrobacterium group]